MYVSVYVCAYVYMQKIAEIKLESCKNIRIRLLQFYPRL